MTICLWKFNFAKNKDIKQATIAQWYLYFLVFLYSKDIWIYLVDQIDFSVSKTRLRVAIHEAFLLCNLLILFSLIIQKTGAMCQITGIFKPLHIQLRQWFWTCGPWPTGGPQSILVWKRRIGIFFLEITCFWPEKPFEFWWRPFFFRDHLFSAEKPFQSNSRLMKIWVKFLSNTLRVGPWKIFKMKMGQG